LLLRGVVCLVVVEESCTGEVCEEASVLNRERLDVTVAQNKDTGWEPASVMEKKGSWQVSAYERYLIVSLFGKIRPKIFVSLLIDYVS
jgi:hypothetical protein